MNGNVSLFSHWMALCVSLRSGPTGTDYGATSGASLPGPVPQEEATGRCIREQKLTSSSDGAWIFLVHQTFEEFVLPWCCICSIRTSKVNPGAKVSSSSNGAQQLPDSNLYFQRIVERPIHIGNSSFWPV